MRVEGRRGGGRIGLALRPLQDAGAPELADAAAIVNDAELAGGANRFLLAGMTNCWARDKNIGYVSAAKVRANVEDNWTERKRYRNSRIYD